MNALFERAVGDNPYTFYSGRVTLTVLMKKANMSDADIKNQMGWELQSNVDRGYYRDIASDMSTSDFEEFQRLIKLKSAFKKKHNPPQGFSRPPEAILRPRMGKRRDS